MGIIAAWNVLFGADNTQFKKVMADSRAEIGKTDNTFKGLLKSLKSDFGKSSVLGQSLKLAAGGGAVGALSGLGRTLSEATAKALELSDAFKAGRISLGELVEQAARGVPVLGGFFQTGRNIREFFTHEEAASRAADLAFAQAQQRSEKFFQQQQKLIEQSKQVRQSFAETRIEAEKAVALLRIPDAGAREFARLEQQRQDQLSKIQEKIAAAEQRYQDAAKAFEKAVREDKPQEDINRANTEFANAAEDRKKILTEGNSAMAQINARYGLEQANAVRDENKTYADLYAERWKGIMDGGKKIGKALLDTLTPKPTLPTFRTQLPNPSFAAEDVFNKRTVTSANLPQPFVEFTRTQKEQLTEAKKTNTELTKQTAAFAARSIVKVVTGW